MDFPTARRGYLVALAATAGCAAFHRLLELLTGDAPTFYLPFVVPVLLAGWTAGLRCGLFATALNLGVVALLFGPAEGWAGAGLVDWGRIATFGVIGAGVSALTEQLHVYRRRAEAEAATARKRERALEQEVEERRAAERRLFASREEFRVLTEAIPQMVWVARPDQSLTYVNNQSRAFAGLTVDELNDGGWIRLVHPDDVPGVRAATAGPLARGEPHVLEFRARHHTGEYRWVAASAVPVRDAAGAIVRWVGSTQDVHDRRTAELDMRQTTATLEARVAERTAALRASEERFRAVVEQATDALFLHAADGTVVDANRRACDGLGYAHAELVGGSFRRFDPFLPAAEHARLLAELGTDPRAGRLVHFESRHRRKDGTDFPVEVRMGLVELNGRPHHMSIARDITARRRAEEAAREGEERFRLAFDHAPIGLALVAPDGKWLRVNERLCGMVGYTAAELLVTDFQAITHPADLDADLGHVRDMLAGTIQTYQMEKRYFHKQGHVVEVLLAVSLVRDAAGRPRYFISQLEDIGERKRAGRALAAQDALLRQFIKYTPAAVAMFDREVRYLQASERWVTDYNLAGRALIGESHYAVFPDIPARWKAVHRRVLAGAVEACAEDPFHRADGTTEWLQWECRPWHAADGTVGGLIMFTQVITARKRAEADLRASEERFRVLFEQSSDAHLIFDEQDGIIDCNPAAVAMLRCPEKAVLLRLHPAVLSPEFQPDGRRSLEKCVEMDATARRDGYHRFDWDHRRLDGEVFPCEVTLTPVALGGRSVLLVVWHDLTERKRADLALRASEERFRAAMEGSLHAVYFLTADRGADGGIADFRFTEVNRRGAELVGRDRDAVLGARLCDLLPVNRTGGFFDRYVRVVETGDPLEEEFALPLDSGIRATWLRHQVVRVGDGVAITTQDITARRLAEEQIRGSLREKEVLLKEIHHRVKNNLQIVSALLELQAGHAPEPGVIDMFTESRGRVRSMALIHERLYRSADLARVDFAEYVVQLADDLYRTYRVSDDDIRLAADVNLPALPIDIAIPCGLLLNELISNCLKHAFRDRAAGTIRVAFRRDPDGTNVLAVADDGVGMPAVVDFTAAPTFGLQLVGTLAEQLDGEVELNTDRGTAITIRFPRRETPT